jgi:glutaminase
VRAPGESSTFTAAEAEAAVSAAHARYRDCEEGAVADYIPALAQMNPDAFGIALVAADGAVFEAGDSDVELSMQSVSKAFNTALVMEQWGARKIVETVGVDATGRALSLNEEVYRSESGTNQRNRAIGQLMSAYGRFPMDPEVATDLYTRGCSVNVTARDLGVMAATLAFGGWNPVTKERVMTREHVPGLLAIMATAGLHDDTGQWLFMTGLPAMSGIGGGLIAVSPGRFGIGAFSPRVDSAGNSVRGRRAIADVSEALGGNPFARFG